MDNNTNFNITKENEYLRRLLENTIKDFASTTLKWQQTFKQIFITSIILIFVSMTIVSSVAIVTYFKYTYEPDNIEEMNTNTNINTNTNTNTNE